MATPTKRSPAVAIAPAYARTERTTRRPQNPFNVITMPFCITPVMMHPVLPGETLKSCMIQSQAWTDPLDSSMKNTGWWQEWHLFYVKHRDMPGFEVGVDGLGKDLIDMFVSNESLASHAEGSAIPRYGAAKGGINFLGNAMTRIVEEYFRDEGETHNGPGNAYLYTTANEAENYRKAQIYGRGRDDTFKKLTMASDYEDHRELLDADGDGDVYVGDEMNRAFNEWAAAHDAGLMDMTYEDWMRTYGGKAQDVDPDRVDYHRPEDIGYHRAFTYPTNTVEPSTGVPAVAVGWRTANAIRKSYRFNEPGWLIALVVHRPKMYLKNQVGLVASMMTTRDSWLPAVLNAESNVGHMLIDDAAGPLAATMDTGDVDYYVSIRDLLLYGEQFINYTPSGSMFATLPTAAAERRYVPDGDINAMFATDASTGTTGGRIRMDGTISLNILGRQRETTQNLTMYRA